MITRKNNVAMTESNDDINHKNVVIIWVSLFCRWSKIFLSTCIKKMMFWHFWLKCLIWTIFLALRRITLPYVCFPQRYVQYHLWSCAICAEWRLKHFMNISRYSSNPAVKTGIRNTVFYSLAGSQFILLKCDGSIWDRGGKYRQKQIHLSFLTFEFDFFL